MGGWTVSGAHGTMVSPEVVVRWGATPPVRRRAEIEGRAMGLDTYASRSRDDIVLTPEDKAVFESLDLKLCEWIGDGSFRGKVYLDVVDTVAGVCLTMEWISPEEVAEMAAAFEACDPEEVSR
ncbi:MAG TPA: hypothetical protein VJ787_06980, partial [Thermoleophilia bacterium]|nr:hypothetical protein [Thermoleophilia bacterium]